MSRTPARILLVVIGLTVAACTREAAEQAPESPPATSAATLFDTMNATVIPKSNKIWELSGNLYDDDGNLDATRLSDAQWTELKDAADAMGAAARSLEAPGIQVAAEGVKISGEGTEGAFGAAEVQAAIDADPQGFSQHATQLVTISDEIAAAAMAHDVMKTDDAQGRLTEVCGACHAKFWYPNQQAQ